MNEARPLLRVREMRPTVDDSHFEADDKTNKWRQALSRSPLMNGTGRCDEWTGGCCAPCVTGSMSGSGEKSLGIKSMRIKCLGIKCLGIKCLGIKCLEIKCLGKKVWE